MQVSLHVVGTTPARLPVHRLAGHLERTYRGVAEFPIGTPVPGIGAPDLAGGYYSDAKFVSCLPQWPHPQNMSLIFTELPIEGNYFARTVRNVSIITTFQSDAALRGSEFTRWDYLVLKCIQEIFWISCKIHSGNGDLRPLAEHGGLFHRDKPGCLFNFSAHKLEEQVEKLRWARIEEDCAERARVFFNVPGVFVSASQRALDRLTRPTLLRSFSRMLNMPTLNFLYGAVIGGLITNLFVASLTQAVPQPVWYLFAGLLLTALIIPLTVHAVNTRRHRRRHAAR